MEKLLRVKAISTEFKLSGSIKRGEMLTVRREEGCYRVVLGEHAGKTIEPHRTIEISQEKAISTHEWNDMEQHYLRQLNDKDAEIGRLKEIISGLTNALNTEKEHYEHLRKALEVIDIYYKQKEPIKNG